MLPKPISAIKRFSQPIKLIKVTQTIENHRPVESEVISDIKAVVQIANKSNINKDYLNYGLEYLQVHTLDAIQLNDYIEYKNKRYRVVENSNYSDYGYYESVCEEVKE